MNCIHFVFIYNLISIYKLKNMKLIFLARAIGQVRIVGNKQENF